MKRVYLALGSNIGAREDLLQKAVTLLQHAGLTVSRVSSVYETEPMYVKAQPSFLNLVVEASTSLFPLQLLHRLQQVEGRLGRKRILANGPRTIDIDLLLYERTVMNGAQLVLPHPKMKERRFVLEPLAELAPDLIHPTERRTVRELLGKTLEQRIARVKFRVEIAEASLDSMLH